MSAIKPKFRHDVEFVSHGTTCRAWLTYPDAVEAGPVPLVILGHGVGGTRAMGLEPYAQRFNQAGFATLIFDYRGFGASEGEPRQLLDPGAELADWLAALAYARSLPDVDASRIALWGTSFAGGLVVSAAARDGAVAATISQCPLLDGRAAALELARYAGLSAVLRLTVHGLWDFALAAVGGTPHYVPIVARTGGMAAMSAADAWDGYERLATPDFRNEVTARTGLLITQFRPIRDAANVKCPALLQLCETDSVAPPSAVEAAAARMPQAELLRYRTGHFDVYVGQDFERSVRDQLAFLRRHLQRTAAHGEQSRTGHEA